MTDEMSIRIDADEYVLRTGADGLDVGRRNGAEVAWLDTVDLGLFSSEARAALERGDTSDAALLIALRGVVQAEVERGG